jgi:hypothetical protein
MFAVIGRQLLGLQIRDGNLRQETQDDKARCFERHPGGRGEMDAVGHDRANVADVELEREQVALPADDVHRVVAVEDRGVGALVLDPELPFVLLRPAIIGDIWHLQNRRIDGSMPPDLLVLAQPDRLRRFDDQQ